ncbi:unnamed protein product, partial [marine sediment metagenome]
TKVYWPAFTRHDFEVALANYQSRQRRFGLVEADEKDKSVALPTGLPLPADKSDALC